MIEFKIDSFYNKIKEGTCTSNFFRRVVSRLTDCHLISPRANSPVYAGSSLGDVRMRCENNFSPLHDGSRSFPLIDLLPMNFLSFGFTLSGFLEKIGNNMKKSISIGIRK